MATDLGTLIQAARERSGLSQSELARRARIVQPDLSRLESGKTMRPPFELLAKIAGELGVSLDDLAAEAGLIRSRRRSKKTEKTQDLNDALNDALGANRALAKALIRIQSTILPTKHQR